MCSVLAGVPEGRRQAEEHGQNESRFELLWRMALDLVLVAAHKLVADDQHEEFPIGA